ncbi:hypothetical protein I0C86_35315 [Plantactinospora sp. S1510]|uniref:Uncharacterized protein n=1 Tax=Plantactinospora alkalitolerans TaxID=2789879 RepID=A0ABS0H7P7_9ACTN|nr:hypothetical protein [Plantactinospora alkalitolerans]MBF9134169.1 hypothetical protein [Plantactinospora alkalitolerans]
MDWMTSMALLTGLAGVLLIGFGGWILLTRRVSRATRRSFRSLTDAGLYMLSTGAAVTLLGLGNLLRAQHRGLLSLVASGLALPLFAVAFFRFRPGQTPRE